MSRAVSEEDLHAYVDHALDSARRVEVARHLGQHPEDAARVRDYAAGREALKTAMAGTASDPVPPELNLLRLLEGRLVRRRASWRIAAGIALGLAAGGGAGWLSRGGLPGGRAGRAIVALTDQALANHAVYAVDARHPVEMAAVERDQLDHWLSNRLDRTLGAPDLAGAGYELLGGRLLATERGRPAALFMYADRQGLRVSVVLRPMAADLDVRRTDAAAGPLRVCAWIDGGMGYAIAGNLPDEELDRLADLVAGTGRN